MVAAAAAAQLAAELAAANAEIAAVGMPAYPGGVAANFTHNLEHVIGLQQVQQRNRITINAGILEVGDLLLVDEDTIIGTLTPNTSAMCKTRLQALKRWAQDRSDDQAPLDIIIFTPSVCREK